MQCSLSPSACCVVSNKLRAASGRFASCAPISRFETHISFRSISRGRPIFVRNQLNGTRLQTTVSNGHRVTCAQWIENSAATDVNVPLEEAWALWEDREKIPRWMPWITSVRVLPENPRMSRWLLSTNQFGRDWEFSWLAENLTPLRYQKIHWRSVPGSGSLRQGLEVQNRGQIRFVRKSPTSCSIKLTISYEVPGPVAPFANLLTPIIEGTLDTDLKRFATFASEASAQRR